ALDRQRPAAELLAAAVAWCLRVGILLLRPQVVARAPPTRRFVIRREGLHHVETRGKTAPPEAARRLGDLDMRLGELVEKPRGHAALPQAADAPVAGEENLHPPPRPGDADVREPALLLESRAAALVERALVRKQPFLPARQEHRIELEALGRMQRHDRDRIGVRSAVGIHDERHMLEEALQVLELLHGAYELLEIFQATLGVRRTIL